MAGRKNSLKKVTIFDVAREAGVSHATVSRVINQSAYVDPEKQLKVIQAMTRLGFAANPHARSLAQNQSHLIGLIQDGVSSGYSGLYNGPIVSGAQAVFTEARYNLILYTSGSKKTSDVAYLTSLVQGITDGFLLLISQNAQDYIQAFQQHHIPYVNVDHQHLNDAGSAVRAANRQGTYEAIEYLIALGHRRIGFITGHIDWGCALERLEGYKLALTKYGIGIEPECIEEGLFNQSSGYAAAQKLLSLPEPPSAIFASNDVEAYGVIEAARERQLRIPEDLSVIGFDDIVSSSHIHPPLTTVRQPLELIGRTAAQMILHHIQNPEMPEQVVDLPTELVIRQTCQAPGEGRR